MGAGRKEFLERRIERAEEELARIECSEARFGTNSDYDQETILVWTQNRFTDTSSSLARSGITYTYVAIKIGMYWYLTNRNYKTTWEDMLRHHLMLAEQVWYAKNLEEL